MIEVGLSRIVIDEKKKEQIIVLKEKKGKRVLSMAIGINEAAAIKIKLSGFKAPRPLTHDLMSDIIVKLGSKLEKVVIDNLVNGTFYAKIHLTNGTKVARIVDARPSDSIALALRTLSPVFVEEQVLTKISQ